MSKIIINLMLITRILSLLHNGFTSIRELD